MGRLEGAFALAIIFAGEHDLMIGASRQSPGRGLGQRAMYLGSDALALASVTDRVSYLDEGDWVVMSQDDASVRTEDGDVVDREIKLTTLTGALVGKGNHRHFMLKEIYEQPTVIGDTLNTFFNPASRTIQLPDLPFDLVAISKVTIIACGTSYLAGMVARYWFERIAGISVEIDIASEFRYRGASMPEGGLAVFVSQSGETADTLARCATHGSRAITRWPWSMCRRAPWRVRRRCTPDSRRARDRRCFDQGVYLPARHTGLSGYRDGARARCDWHEVEAHLSAAIAEVPARGRRGAASR